MTNDRCEKIFCNSFQINSWIKSWDIFLIHSRNTVWCEIFSLTENKYGWRRLLFEKNLGQMKEKYPCRVVLTWRTNRKEKKTSYYFCHLILVLSLRLICLCSMKSWSIPSIHSFSWHIDVISPHERSISLFFLHKFRVKSNLYWRKRKSVF